MHNITPFSHNGYMKSLEFYENYITLFYLEKTNFLKYYINLEPGAASVTWLTASSRAGGQIRCTATGAPI
jgi:hypothetical protein